MPRFAELEQALAGLLEAAAPGSFTSPDPGEWSADQVLAHVVASDRMVAAAAAELLAGRVPVIDNRPTQSLAYLEAIAGSAGGFDELVRLVERSGHEVLTLARQLDESRLDVNVPAILMDGGRIRVERPIPFATLLKPFHVEGHTAQLTALAR